MTRHIQNRSILRATVATGILLAAASCSALEKAGETLDSGSRSINKVASKVTGSVDRTVDSATGSVNQATKAVTDPVDDARARSEEARRKLEDAANMPLETVEGVEASAQRTIDEAARGVEDAAATGQSPRNR